MTRHDLVVHLKTTSFFVRLPYLLWERMDNSVRLFVSSSNWKDFKFIIDGKLNSEIENVDNTKGGIYCFYINSNIIHSAQKILVYIGRAQITEHQNLRKRIKEYYGYIIHKDRDERPLIEELFSEYRNYLYCKYIELDDNEYIKKLEKELLKTLVPYANSDIPDGEVSSATRAAF